MNNNEFINNKDAGKLLDKAIKFAVDKHAGQFRKGTNIPYITHPLETMSILNSMRADTNLLIAGLLHDTLEDTKATKEEITELFNKDIANLVDGVTKISKMNFSSKAEHT